jgi:hypothetical protein
MWVDHVIADLVVDLGDDLKVLKLFFPGYVGDGVLLRPRRGRRVA